MHELIGVGEPTHTGTVEVPVSPGAWCWLRADAAGATGYALVPPHKGVQTVTLDLDAARLHVLLLDHTLLRPVAGADVRIALRPESPTAKLRIARQATTFRAGPNRKFVREVASDSYRGARPGCRWHGTGIAKASADPRTGGRGIGVAAVLGSAAGRVVATIGDRNPA